MIADLSGNDTIDLRGIDADTGTNRDDAFAFSTGGSAANSVWITTNGGNAVIWGDTDGDGSADFSIAVPGTSSLTEDDFLL